MTFWEKSVIFGLRSVNYHIGTNTKEPYPCVFVNYGILGGVMKKYFIDKLLFLVIGIGIMLCIPLLCGDIFTVVLEILVAFVWTYLCRGILFLPLDLLCGKKQFMLIF